jgi:hypothetical protein
MIPFIGTFKNWRIQTVKEYMSSYIKLGKGHGNLG